MDADLESSYEPWSQVPKLLQNGSLHYIGCPLKGYYCRLSLSLSLSLAMYICMSYDNGSYASGILLHTI